MKIVFMGTPEFAVPSLRVLVENGYEVVGVITAPDKPQGRGKKLKGSAVKEYAVSQGLNVFQPVNLKSEEFLGELRVLKADLQIVVAFRMLPEAVWNMPPLGTFNLHGSLLPQYRGAAPINWAVINGEKETGVTTFFLKHEIDTGSIIFQEREQILAEDNVGTLYERLMHKGAGLVLKTVKAIESNKYELSPQVDDGNLKSAPKIHKETCEIDWTQSSVQIVNFVRGLSPHPAAWTTINGKKYKIYKVTLAGNSNLSSGESRIKDLKTILMGTGDGCVSIDEMQPEGKKRMKADDFLRGNTL
ncbi:methionyl-tRNA formyltransferase [Reichenbachiella sp. MALMAid0571]|uniref:methionyl-tRNA formyltransferase n=1 Tax=Reichenbachiella sp. MALMAid0571 TaxID=3143939 RepID=UPI0032DF807A